MTNITVTLVTLVTLVTQLDALTQLEDKKCEPRPEIGYAAIQKRREEDVGEAS